MSRADGSVLVLGVGNILLGDEGVGVRLIEALAADSGERLPASAEIVDGGTLGLDLLPLVDDARAMLLIDAVDSGSEPGSIVLLRGDQLRAQVGGTLSAHQVGVGDLVAVARLRGTLPDRTSLLGIQPASMDVGLELSPLVARAIPAALRAAREEIAAMAAGR
jgi:hydrogenase maturation protease